jgi:7,8-dihydro-6-hydroxymethylpterin dimethyltransferase
MEATPEKQDSYCETTRSVCPKCLRTLDAEIIIRNGRVILCKVCPSHGKFEVLLSSDAQMYLASLPYNKPGQMPLSFSTEVAKGCPDDCGLCPEHKQHTCLALIEVTSRCNLNCPVCFADSQPAFDLSLSQVERMIDRFVELEGNPEVLQFSGGEPTIHPDILPMLHAANKKGIQMVMLNTNGIRIAQDDKFLAGLADARPTVYLQFDGFSDRAHSLLRGQNLLDVKLQALDRLTQAKLDVVLVPTIASHINHDQIGAIVRFGIEHPAVCGVAFQPMTHAGRYDDFDPLGRETIADVIHGMVEQTQGLFFESDFIPVPCCHPTCRSATYLYVDDGKATPIPRILEVDKYLNYAANRALPEIKPEILTALDGLWSASSVPGSKRMEDRVRASCCNLPFLSKVKHLKRHVFTIVIQDFGDAYTMDLNVLHKCCVGVLIPDGRMIPFCAYNSLGYRQRIRTEIAAYALSHGG